MANCDVLQDRVSRVLGKGIGGDVRGAKTGEGCKLLGNPIIRIKLQPVLVVHPTVTGTTPVCVPV